MVSEIGAVGDVRSDRGGPRQFIIGFSNSREGYIGQDGLQLQATKHNTRYLRQERSSLVSRYGNQLGSPR